MPNVLSISMGNSVEEICQTMAMIYADKHWEDFRKEMQIDDNESEVMHNDYRHMLCVELFRNHLVLNILLTLWGEKQLTEYVEGLADHPHGNDTE